MLNDGGVYRILTNDTKIKTQNKSPRKFFEKSYIDKQCAGCLITKT